jgi:sulfite reductase alpha subunit-like flavoprotein
MEAPTAEQPVVCAGIGSGLAPHIAFLRDRVHAAELGTKVAPFSLYFGNRFKEEEFLYQNELEAFADKYSDWFTLHTAFSRDNPDKKVYVQDLVAETDDARRLLLEPPNGMLYVCGNRGLPKPLQDALVKAFSQSSTDPTEIERAKSAMEFMFVHGRAQQEVW